MDYSCIAQRLSRIPCFFTSLVFLPALLQTLNSASQLDVPFLFAAWFRTIHRLPTLSIIPFSATKWRLPNYLNQPHILNFDVLLIDWSVSVFERWVHKIILALIIDLRIKNSILLSIASKLIPLVIAILRGEWHTGHRLPKPSSTAKPTSWFKSLFETKQQHPHSMRLLPKLVLLVLVRGAATWLRTSDSLDILGFCEKK